LSERVAQVLRRAACAALLLSALLALPSTGHACKFVPTPWDELRAGWARGCGHALCGRVVATRPREATGSSCDGEQPRLDLQRDIAAAQIVLLGEVHDNPEHHRFRAELLRERRTPFGAVFEQFRSDQSQALATFQALKKSVPASGDLAELKRLTDWDKSGWAKGGYDPLLEAAIKAGLPIYAADPARETIKKVAKHGDAVLPDDELKRLGLDKPLPEPSQEALLDQLEQSHCGLMPKTAFGNLAFAQRYRDAHQSDAVLKAAQGHGSAVLLAGNGHVRKDRGVPYYLKQRAPDKKVVSVMLIEVEDGKTDPEAYVERGPGGEPTADYVVFTPRAERPDPCEEMRKVMKSRN
jgi:uncharacterized iron-regulated protein